MPPKTPVETIVNGNAVEFLCEPHQSLLEILREVLGLTGSKEGCNNGNCGACNVILDDVLVNACLVLAVEVQGKRYLNHRGHRQCYWAPSIARRVPRICRLAVWHLYAWFYRLLLCFVAAKSTSNRVRSSPLAGWQLVSLHWL